jgi:transglutaminase-like putative cysteine protease
MRVAINHETVYRYHSPANYSIQYLRLTPLSGPNQRVISWKLSTPGNLRTWTDGFGNQAHVLVVDEPHDEIRITAMGEVELADSGSPLLSEHDPLPPEIFLRSTRLTEPDDRIRAFSNGFRPGIISNARKGLDGLMAGIRDTVEYRPGVTHSATSARQALDARAGVCQDHAHLFVTCCRSLGLPARYVSGYLCTDAVGDERMASHAWAEAWVEGSGWLSYDVANRMSNAKAHVRVAIGLDYMDAAPVRGVRKGGGDEELDVEVTVGDAVEVQKAQKALQHQAQQ